MLDTVLCLGLADDKELSLVIQIQLLTCETIQVYFENRTLVRPFLTRNHNLQIDLLWLSSEVSKMLSSISRYRFSLSLKKFGLNMFRHLFSHVPIDFINNIIVLFTFLNNSYQSIFTRIKFKFLGFLRLKLSENWLLGCLEKK